MGKLYDRIDRDFDVERINRMEQQLSADIANGVVSGMVLNEVTYVGRRSMQIRDSFDALRKSFDMQLLASGNLMRDLRYALRTFDRCTRCHLDKNGKRKWCEAHFKMRYILKNVHDAAEENLARRATLGIVHDDADAPAEELNELETWYYSDRREGVWPGKTPEVLAYNKEQYGSLDYRGWLTMLLQEEEITFAAYENELARLREAGGK